MNTQSLPTLQVFQSFSRECLFQSCPEEFTRSLCEWINVLLKVNPAKHKKTSLSNVLRRNFSVLSLKRLNWKQRRDILASEKGLQLLKVITPLVNNQMSWYGAICSHTCFWAQQQKFAYSVSYIVGTSIISGWQHVHVPKWLGRKGN